MAYPSLLNSFPSLWDGLHLQVPVLVEQRACGRVKMFCFAPNAAVFWGKKGRGCDFFFLFSIPSLSFPAPSVSLTHHFILLPLCLPPLVSCPSPLSACFGPFFPTSQCHPLPQTLSFESIAVFPPPGCFLVLPHPHLLPRVADQGPQSHDYKGSERNSCPCRSASHRDQVTKRGCEPVPLVRLSKQH